MFDESGYDEYRKAEVEARAASASSEQLVLMLVDGFMDEISRLEGHLSAFNDPSNSVDLKSKNLEKKGQSITKCLKILRGLDTALDMESGGDIASQLHDLYEFMGKKFLDLSISNNLEDLKPIKDTMSELREGWVGMAAA